MNSLSSITGKIVGIWGYGTTGRSLLAFCSRLNPASLHLFDAKPLAPDSTNNLALQGITTYAPDAFDLFAKTCDIILPSPGIDLRPYPHLQQRIIPELALFHEHWKRPYVGITGTIGKTSVTHLLTQSLKQDGVAAYEGGNIGKGMLDLIDHTEENAHAILELSSFHLEHASPQPDLAIITNIYQNHLDRHDSFDAYICAKLRIIAQQTTAQRALLPLALAPLVRSHYPTRSYAWFSATPRPTTTLPEGDCLYMLEDNEVIRYQNGERVYRGSLPEPLISFAENWLIIMAARDLLGYEPTCTITTGITVPEHRLAPIKTYRGITFYNDSKSTIPEATIAALERLYPASIVLFLGGLSKGVDRSSLPARVAPFVRTIICFGAEADQLHAWCSAQGITSYAYATLEEAFAGYLRLAQEGDQVLLSPSGSSFDLFKDYKARGARFVELVTEFAGSSDH